MSKYLTSIAAGVCLVAMPMVASAQATRTWVSGVGDDANPCSRTAPCKTFAGAISKTATAGQINCLDPGGFGAVTITKSIAIMCDGVEAGVLVSGTNGINVSAGATDVVYLSGLDLEGLGSNASSTSPNGVNIASAGMVHITNSTIRGFQNGVSVTPSSGATEIRISNTQIADNSAEGVITKPTGSGSVRITIAHSRVTNNGGDGVFANANVTSGNVKLAASDTEVSHNAADGFTVFSNSGVAQMNLINCTAFNNSRGVNASGSNAVARFGGCNIFANGTGVNQDTSGQALSYKNNQIDGNGTQGSFGTLNPE